MFSLYLAFIRATSGFNGHFCEVLHRSKRVSELLSVGVIDQVTFNTHTTYAQTKSQKHFALYALHFGFANIGALYEFFQPLFKLNDASQPTSASQAVNQSVVGSYCCQQWLLLLLPFVCCLHFAAVILAYCCYHKRRDHQRNRHCCIYLYIVNSFVVIRWSNDPLRSESNDVALESNVAVIIRHVCYFLLVFSPIKSLCGCDLVTCNSKKRPIEVLWESYIVKNLTRL